MRVRIRIYGHHINVEAYHSLFQPITLVREHMILTSNLIIPMNLLSDDKFRQFHTLTIRLCGKKGGAVENMVYYKDSNPFTVHMLLLWFSGWYSFYRLKQKKPLPKMNFVVSLAKTIAKSQNSPYVVR
jgi:hypothetical protein